jgi:hypothetical protein
MHDQYLVRKYEKGTTGINYLLVEDRDEGRGEGECYE